MPHHTTLSERLRGLPPTPIARLRAERVGHLELLRSAQLQQTGLDVPKRGARA
jgi:hypothetical protein